MLTQVAADGGQRHGIVWDFLGKGFVQPLLKQRLRLALASCSSSCRAPGEGRRWAWKKS
jgi:hypothetical protein